MSGYVTNLNIGNFGRFANGAYQVAAVFGIARRNGLTPVFPLWRNSWHRDAFGSTEDIDLYKHFVNPLPSLPDGVNFTDHPVDWGYHDIVLPDGNWNISGHFQSTKYFEHCIDEVRWHFKMVDEPPQNDYVAVHVRLGDYDNAYHPRLGLEYYLKAFAQFPEGPTKYLIFSDDLSAAQEMFNEFDNRLPWEIEFSMGNDYIQDFKLMKTCKSFIIGNSSYSAMAAVLGEHPEKRVVAPRPWFGKAYANINGEDIYEPDWSIVEWEKAA